MKALKRADVLAAALIIAIGMPTVYYFIRFNDKGYVEQKLLERYIEKKKREDIVLQTGARTKTMDVDVSFKNIKREDLGKIKTGDKELFPDNTAAAEVIWVGEPKANNFLVDMGPSKKTVLGRTNAEDGLLSVPAKIRLKGVVSTAGVFNYKSIEVRDLALFNFNCGKYEALFAIEAKE